MKPIFILGCPRSGTTMLAGLFHSTGWGSGVETHFITKFASDAEGVDLANQRAFNELVNRIISHRAVQQWEIEWNLDELFQRCEPKTYPVLADAICQARSNKLGHRSWADKTPHYSFDVMQLADWFPEARFVVIHRDGRDVAHSLLNRNWGPNNIWACADYWRRCCQSLLNAEATLPENRMHSLRYEDLLSEPESVLDNLSDFLGLEDAERLAPLSDDHLQTNNFNKWKRNLSDRQIRLFERTAGDVLSQLGYSASHEHRPISTVKRLIFKADDRVRWAKFMFDQNIVDGIKIRFLGKQPFAE